MAKITEKITIKKFILGVLIVMSIVIMFALSINPILDKIDENRFITLDKNMQKLFSELESKTNFDSAWVYEKKCDPEYSGPWPTGSFFCATTISMDKSISNVDELNNIHDTVYQIINDSKMLKATSELDKQLPNDFGKKFVISKANRIYIERNSNIKCNYSIGIYQKVENISLYSDSFGSKISNNIGINRIWVECSDRSRSNWYIAK